MEQEKKTVTFTAKPITLCAWLFGLGQATPSDPAAIKIFATVTTISKMADQEGTYTLTVDLVTGSSQLWHGSCKKITS